MKFKYKNKHLYTNLILGVLWIIFGAGSYYFNDQNSIWWQGSQIGFGVAYLAFYGFNYFKGYIVIENEIIEEKGLFGKKLALKDVIRIKKFAGDYILKTKDKELGINQALIDPDSMADLKNYLIAYFKNRENKSEFAID